MNTQKNNNNNKNNNNIHISNETSSLDKIIVKRNSHSNLKTFKTITNNSSIGKQDKDFILFFQVSPVNTCSLNKKLSLAICVWTPGYEKNETQNL